MGTLERLQERELNGGMSKVAILGAGYVGTGVLHVLFNTPSVVPALVINRDVSRAVEGFRLLGYAESDVVVSRNADEMNQALSAGKAVVSDDYELIHKLPIDIVIEATGAIDYGAKVILNMLDGGKDVISFNAEADALFAYEFHRRAKLKGVIYSIADGDQPGAQLRIAEQVEAMGFEISTYINCKRHLNVHQTPESGSDYSARDATSAHMTTSFGDGTKMQIEQAVVANICSCIPVKRGMTGIETTVENASKDISSALPEGKYVEFTRAGDFAAGVGVIARHKSKTLHKKAMQLYKMGDGPDYFFFRPFHLVHLELPNTISDVLLDRRPLGVVNEPHTTEVIAIAKKSLTVGEKLDCIGGFTAYGHLASIEDAQDCLPMCLIEYATVISSVEIDQPIKLSSVELDTSIGAVQLWVQLQKQWNRNLEFVKRAKC